MDKSALLAQWLKAHPSAIGKVVDFDPQSNKLYRPDLTAGNPGLDRATAVDVDKFSRWVNEKLRANDCRYGVGGYLENRTIYAHSPHFGFGGTARSLHLGVDIWGESGLPIYSPLPGTLHSFSDNNNPGDYGPTLIIEHDLDELKLYTLYGHLSRASLAGLRVGQPVQANQKIAALGKATENGGWPPHLHFQLIFDMEGKHGDYPGVCSPREKKRYLKLIADPQLLLQFPPAFNEAKSGKRKAL